PLGILIGKRLQNIAKLVVHCRSFRLRVHCAIIDVARPVQWVPTIRFTLMSRPAVILLSGGLDSATAAAVARSGGFELYARSFDYGQRHRHELEAARRVAQSLGVKRHVTLTIDLRQFGASALTADIAVPKGRTAEVMSHGIPITYVPARNTVFLSL